MFGLCAKGGVVSGFALGLIVLMSLRPAIPWRAALLHCSEGVKEFVGPEQDVSNRGSGGVLFSLVPSHAARRRFTRELIYAICRMRFRFAYVTSAIVGC